MKMDKIRRSYDAEFKLTTQKDSASGAPMSKDAKTCPCNPKLPMTYVYRMMAWAKINPGIL